MDVLQKHADYQRKLVDVAVRLLKPGGTLVYSTCTFSPLENERQIAFMLKTYPLVLVSIPAHLRALGDAGLPEQGLTDVERRCVLRFHPGSVRYDTMGFFCAKFQKSTA
jgi:16S rRNA C967 or C1407 C5-methylase (RsmB/RsmF family)